MAIRLATLPVREVMTLTGIDGYPRWAGDVTVDDGLIERHLANDSLIAPDDSRDPNAQVPATEHAGRIAWLIRNVRPNRCSVTIRDGRIQDGNHRFAAALYRGDDLVTCCIME